MLRQAGLAGQLQQLASDVLGGVSNSVLSNDSAVADQIPDFVLVPRYDIQASAGPGAFTDQEQIVDYLAFSRDWVSRTLRVDPSKLVLISAVGDSMEPAIRAGDLLLVDTSVGSFIDDAIYVIVMFEHLVVKRIQRFFRGAVIVKSDNPAYIEQTLGPDEAADVQVAGRVRWIGRMI